MALNGSVHTNDYETRYYTVDWTADQSVGNNSSTIHWTLSCAGGQAYGGTGWYAERDLRLYVAGNLVVNKTDFVKRYAGNIASGSVVVNHAPDGTAGFNINLEAAVYVSSVNLRGSSDFRLDNIARASSPSCVDWPNNKQDVGNMGDTIVIHMNRNSEAFTHSVRYIFGNASGTIGENVAQNVSWTIPLDLAGQVPNATSGTGTISVDTYNGPTKIGTKTCLFTCTVPNTVIPAMTAANVTVDNSASSVVAGWGLCVVGFSKPRITASATGARGSTIRSYSVDGVYHAAQSDGSLSFTGGAFSSAEDKTFNICATDSRGRTSEVRSVVKSDIVAYHNPYVSAFTVRRNPANNLQVTVHAVWVFASVQGKNSATATLSYKLSTGKVWTTYGNLTNDTNTTLTTIFTEESSYDFRLTVTDKLGRSTSYEATIPTAEVLLDFRAGGKGLGIGKIAETDSLEVAMDAKFMKDLWITDVSYKGDNINLRNVRNLVDWNKLLNKPNVFPPANHSHSYLPLEGGSLSGSLSVNGISNGHGTPYGWLDFYSGENNMVNMFIATNDGNRFTIRTQNGCDGITFRPNDGESDGNVSVVGSIVYTESCFQFSAKKFKKNITKIMDADKLLSLEPVEFDYKDTGTHSVGLIADDVAKYFPNLIYYENEKVTGLNYVGLIPYMIKKIQMQQEEIDELKAKKNDGGN
jgi:hypothetical protein